MPIKYGLRIGNIGIEFPSREDREKALIFFTKGSDVVISENSGPVYSSGKGTFSVYDRDPSIQVNRCHKCKGEFTTDTCSSRTYPNKNSWEKNYSNETDYICDACCQKAIKEKELFDARAALAAAEG